MNQPVDIQRELATVRAVDAEGFARLSEADDEAALKAPAPPRAVLDETINRYRGRIANTVGHAPIEILIQAGREHARDALIGGTSG